MTICDLPQSALPVKSFMNRSEHASCRACVEPSKEKVHWHAAGAVLLAHCGRRTLESYIAM